MLGELSLLIIWRFLVLLFGYLLKILFLFIELFGLFFLEVLLFV